MTGAGTVAVSPEERDLNKDVWSRSAPPYRVRAIVLLIVNVLLFGGLGCFAYWMRSGKPFAPAMGGYWDELFLTLRFTGDSQVTLASFLAGPMSVKDVPMLIPILGLLLAALVTIPILVAILYRFWSCLPFVAVVGFLAVMPWLAITLLLSCVVASVKPFRLPWRFASALLALIPIVVYLILASGGGTPAGGWANPIDKIKYLAPWVIAMVASTLLAGVVLTIAKLVDYRPGAIAPLLAVMFGLPVALFEFKVGRDELYYRLLEQELRLFEDVSAAELMERRAEETWLKQTEPRMDLQKWQAFVSMFWALEMDSRGSAQDWTSALTKYKQKLVRHCDWFIKYFPDSRYAPNALYIKGRTLSTRVDLGEFRRTEWIRYYDDFPHQASWTAWRMIVENRADSPLSAVALLRLAQLDARNGLMPEAVESLDRLIAKFDPPGGRPTQAAEEEDQGAWSALLRRSPPEAGLNVTLERPLLEAHRLRDLLTANRDPIYGYAPLCGIRDPQQSSHLGLLRLVPREDQYIQNLYRLKERYPRCQIEDNIDLEIAKATPPGPGRTKLLLDFVDHYESREVDAMPEALFRLGSAFREDKQRSEADERFVQLLQQYPSSIWASQARIYAPARASTGGKGAS